MLPLQAAVEPLAELVRAISERRRLTILALDPAAGSVVVVASVGENALTVGESVRLDEYPGLRITLSEASERAVGLDDPGISEELREFSLAFGFRVAFLVPLSSLGELAGWVVIDEPGSERAFGERERRLLSAAVRQAGTLLENAEMHQQASVRQRTFEGIAQLGVVLTSTLHLEHAARQVVEYGRILTGVPAFILLYRSEGAAEFSVLASEGVSEEITECTLRPIEAAAIDLERMGVYSTSQLQSVAPSRLFNHCEREGFKEALIAPLTTAGARLRGMLVGLDRRALQVDDGQKTAFHLLTMQATNAIWNAERYEAQTRAQRDLAIELARSRTLQEAAVAATSSADMEEVARRVLRALREHMRPTAGDIRLLDHDRRHLTLLASFGYPEPTRCRIAHTRMDDEWALPARTVREDRVLTHEDDRRSPERIGVLREAGVLDARYATLPIRSRGAVLGVLSLVFEEKRPFTQEERVLGQTVADVVGQAFENIRIYRAEHDVAETLQNSLLVLPERVPGVRFEHLYRSATEAAHVGGDFYDVFEMEHDRLGIVVGDVSGKGVEAAALTMVARNAIRAYAYEGASPAGTLRKVNGMIWRMSEAGSFVTVFFAILEADSGRLDYCGAGHPPALILREEGGIDATEASSPFLGAFESAEYVDERAHLGPSDILFLCTDGVLEARDAGGGFFGEERLLEALESSRTPAEACDRVFESVAAFAGGKLSDDLALLALVLQPDAEDASRARATAAEA